jgi:hypothetical protein
VSTSSMASRRLAMGLTALLWLAGSAYLIRAELQAPTPDWVVIATTPLVWIVVIALPILAHYALREREVIASVLLLLAALVGSAYTLQGTIGRQSESRDFKVADAQAQNFAIDERKAELATARERLSDANKYADDEMTGQECRKRCQDWRLRAKEVQAHIDQLVMQIGSLGPEKPVASGELRIAAIVSYFTGKPVPEVSSVVGLLLPNVFGIFVELAALALGYYGWRPSRVNPSLALSMPATVSDSVPERKRAVLETLAKSGRPLSNAELAFLMGCSEGESSRRVSALNGKVQKIRSGREVAISLLN